MDSPADLLSDTRGMIGRLAEPPRTRVWTIGPPKARFVDRIEPLAAVRRLAESERDSPAVMVVHGLVQIGKTAFLRRTAAALEDLFDIGLEVDLAPLRHEGGVPMDDVMAGVLEDLYVDPAQIPRTLAQKVSRFRAMTSRQRVLVLVDGAATVAEFRDLVPNSARALVLVAADTAIADVDHDLLKLHGLDHEHGVQLLVRASGNDQVGAEQGRAAELVELCGGSPALLTGAGAQLRGLDGDAVLDAVAELTDALRGFAASGDGRTVEWARMAMTVFDPAYRALTADSARLYRILGALPGDSHPVGVVAAASGWDDRSTREHMQGLLAAAFVEVRPGGGFALAGAVRLHASRTADAVASSEELDAVRARAVRSWFEHVAAADRAVVAQRFRVGSAPAGTVQFASADEAMRWLSYWHVALLRVLREAAAQGLDNEVWQIVEALWPFHSNHSFTQAWSEELTLATEAAVRAGNRRAEVRMRSLRSRVLVELGNSTAARADITEALAILKNTFPDDALLAAFLDFQGNLLLGLGEVEEALRSYDEALTINERLGDQRGVALQSQFRGRCLWRLGLLAEALAAFDRADEAIAPFGDARSEARIAFSRAQALADAGQVVTAVGALRRSLERAEQLGRTSLLVEPLQLLADLAAQVGDAVTEDEVRQKLDQLEPTAL